MKIGIIGAGNIGATLAKHFRQLQHTVFIANSRGPETLATVAKETGAIPVLIREAADGVDLLVIAIPMKSVPELPQDLLANLPPESPIIDTGNYYPLRDGRISDIDRGLAESAWTSGHLGRPMVKAMNNIVADSLLRKGLPRGAKQRIALPVAGENAPSKKTIMDLLDAIGFDSLDAGSLSDSWRFQPGTPAYCPDPTIQQLPKLLKRAKRDKAPTSRDMAAKLMAKLPPDFPPQELVRVSRLSAGLDLLNPRSWFALLHLLYAAIFSL